MSNDGEVGIEGSLLEHITNLHETLPLPGLKCIGLITDNGDTQRCYVVLSIW